MPDRNVKATPLRRMQTVASLTVGQHLLSTSPGEERLMLNSRHLVYPC